MSKGLKWGAAAAVVLALGAVFAWRIEVTAGRVLAQSYSQPVAPLRVDPSPAMAAEGARLAVVNGCTDCHGKALTGKVALDGWFGTRLTAPNLTKVAQKLTPAQLAAAIRFGVRPDGHSLFAMPVHRYLTESDQDNAAIIAWLKSLKPLPDAVPATSWRFDGKLMLALGLIPAAAPSAVLADRGPLATPSGMMAHGAYLTHTLCASCHGKDLSGEAEQHSPDLRFSIVHYSPDAFEHFFHTGIARKGHGSETMTALIQRRFHALTRNEVQAIYYYLNHSRPASPLINAE